MIRDSGFPKKPVHQVSPAISQLKKLEHLNVSANELLSLPETLCLSTQLQVSRIFRICTRIAPGFKTIQNLYQNQLKRLEHLNVSANELLSLPETLNLSTQLQDSTPS